ncbi:hypothetical protein [Leptospira santarosai]|uniref:hypothetical protein n=1 Tax=Leptospira santarosai TaxID=28183 RepID=UPI0024AFCD88|nr:hypothetical protein [Leptospira santarosai]MDI7191250.1 hypothetical protein [Leptospira santarosai]MDI7212118.1 hypothetical protein [Leptospira santarosai]MDI7222735.1 hypothetical protein [Leptospira santarosai]
MPHLNHKGCNLFIQYKLASLLQTERAEEYKYWETAYYRFQIPHESYDRITGDHYFDFHQFNSLKKLANEDYPVFYVANSVILEKELLDCARAQNLRESCSWFSVADISDNHRYLSFVDGDGHGLLHSEPVKIAKKPFVSIVESIDNGSQEKTNVSTDIKYLRTVIEDFENRTEVSSEFRLNYAFDQISNRIPDEIRSQIKVRIIASRLYSYFGLQWLKF